VIVNTWGKNGCVAETIPDPSNRNHHHRDSLLVPPFETWKFACKGVVKLCVACRVGFSVVSRYFIIIMMASPNSPLTVLFYVTVVFS